MKCIHRTLALSLLLFAAATTSAEPVTPEQALQQARQFLQQKQRTCDATPVKSQFAIRKSQISARPKDACYQRDARIHESQPTLPPYYIFNTEGGQGFVIIAGDDRAETILGYTDQGTFDPTNVPEGLDWLLTSYTDQMEALVPDASPSGKRPSPSHVAPRTPVPPLLPFLWNQGEPYNILCPRYLNRDGSEGDRSATGCVATAVAQVMGYYRYPDATQRYIPAYTVDYDTDEGKKTVRMQGVQRGATIDWDNILPVYDGNSTARQDTAIAELMLYVGLGSKMSYGASSATFLSTACDALVNYFGYDDGTHIESRGNYTIAGWHDLLYNELATGHPIAFSAVNSGGGHAFVLDGCDAEGLFHVNWGWGGLDNGYFRIDVLAPDVGTGIGASPTPDGYNMGQEAIIGMQLPDDIKADPVQPCLTANDWELRPGNVFFANFVNWTGINTTWDMGIGYADADGNIVPIGNKATAQINANYYSGQSFTITGLPAGTYHVVPISKRASTNNWLSHVNPDIRYVLVTVDDSGQTTVELRPIESIEVTGINFPGNHRTGDRQTVRATFRNLGDEYFREVHLFASTTDYMGESLGRTALTMEEGGEGTTSFFFTPDHAGTWNVWLCLDDRGNHILAQTTVDISDEGTAGGYNLRYVSHTVTNRSNGNVYGNRMHGKVNILNQATETFDGNVRLWLFKQADNGGFYGDASVYRHITVEPRKTATVTYAFDDLQLGANYVMSILYEEGGDIQDGGLKNMGRTQAGVVYWQQDLTLSGMAPAATISIPNGAATVDFSCAQNAVKTVRPNSNPNALYLFPEGSTVPDGLEEANVVVGSQAGTIRLSDGYTFYTPVAFTAAEAVYERPTTDDGSWQTLTLPFAPQQLPEGLKVLALTGETTNQLPYFTATTDVLPYVPYLVSSNAASTPSEAYRFTAANAKFPTTTLSNVANGIAAGIPVVTDNYRFIGTTIKTRLSGLYKLDAAQTAFMPAPANMLTEAFNAYFTTTLSLDTITFETDQLSAISDPINQWSNRISSNSKSFDLLGRQRSTYNDQRSTSPRLRIINGKKIITH